MLSHALGLLKPVWLCSRPISRYALTWWCYGCNCGALSWQSLDLGYECDNSCLLRVILYFMSKLLWSCNGITTRTNEEHKSLHCFCNGVGRGEGRGEVSSSVEMTGALEITLCFAFST